MTDTDYDGSKPLNNARQEVFAQNLAKGMSATQAYTEAGYKPSDPHASRLASNGKVQDRIAWLQGQVAEKMVANRAWVMARLVDNVKNSQETMPDGAFRAPQTAKVSLELIGKELNMFKEVKLIGLANVNDMTEPQLIAFLGLEGLPEEEIADRLRAFLGITGDASAPFLITPLPGDDNTTRH